MKMLFLLSFCGAVFTVSSQDIWIKRDSVNGPPRGSAASFELNHEAFMVGGVNVEEFKRKMYSYDLEQDDWDDEIALGGIAGEGLERGSAIGFSANGYGFIGLGSGLTTNLNDLWRYDPETESWTQMADFEGTGRSGAVAFEIDDIAYVGTGQDASGLKDDFYKYDPIANTWTELDDFEGSKRKEAVGFTMGGKGYIGTGKGNSGYFKDFWEYNPLTDNWTQKSDFPGTPRMGAVGCGVFPNAYIMLGEDNTFAYKKDVWEYNYFGNIWTQRADYMGGTRTQANAVVVDNRIFVGLGYNGTYQDDFYEYERIVGMEDLNQEYTFEIYPNPTQGQFTISFSSELNNPTIQIFDLKGVLLNSMFSIQTTSNSQLIITPLNSVTKGVYFISIYSNSHYLTTKRIIINE